MVSAFDDRSDEDVDGVELVLVQKRAQDPAATFDQDVGHASPARAPRAKATIGTRPMPGKTTTSQPSSRSFGRIGAGRPIGDGHQHRALRGRLDEPARERQLRRAVEHDPGRRAGPAGRAVSSGSSATTVPMPTTIASILPRSSWTKLRDDSDEIHRLSPVRTAVLPSRVIAHLAVT